MKGTSKLPDLDVFNKNGGRKLSFNYQTLEQQVLKMNLSKFQLGEEPIRTIRARAGVKVTISTFPRDKNLKRL